MITVGIDIGARNSQVTILKDDREILALASALTAFDQEVSAEQALNKACQDAGISVDEINQFISTGVGRSFAPHNPKQVTEITAATKGAHFLFPTARTTIDVGAEEGRAIKLDASGSVKDFAVNEKCAAGAGSFIEIMARTLECSVEEFADLSLKSTESVPINAQCTIFAESEAVSLIHANTPLCDIARAIHDAIADRIAGVVHRVGIERDVILCGGVAYNKGLIESLKKTLKLDALIVPETPEYLGAIGAALAHD
ncbi:MAG: acyl-CoA dehydratase activase [Thermodesulfobacteriota bacterium]|nr:acyl-CoA dehydratase activase [Thermodesulfobacteriota bacterium]